MAGKKTTSPWKSETFRVASYEMSVRIAGPIRATPVVLIHGIGVSSAYYSQLAHELSVNFRVYVLDMPGYGETENPKSTLDIPALARAVEAFTRLYRLKGSVLIGHSMGCQVATRMISRSPKYYSKYVLIGPTVNDNERTIIWQVARLIQDVLREPIGLNLIIFRDYLRMGVLRYLQTVRLMLADRIESTIVNCRIPGLIVRGEKDPIAPAEWLGRLSSVAPDAQVATIAGASHTAQYKKPIEIASICRNFIGN